MLKLHALAKMLQRHLSDIDHNLYLPCVRRREATLPLHELLAAVMWFGYCGMRCFKRYAQIVLPLHFQGRCLSYKRWCWWRTRLSALAEAICEKIAWKTGFRGEMVVDTTALPVCGIQRERDHKCFAKTAGKSRSSLGWFYGFKLHLLVSTSGALLRFWLTPANVHDSRSLERVDFLKDVQGVLLADNAYRGQQRQQRLQQQGIALLAKPRKKQCKEMSTKRWRIETVIGQLKDRYGLGNLRSCRCISTLRATVFSALTLYTLDRER